MPHWKSLQGKEYLGSWDFDEGEEKVVTITAYDSETIKNPLKDDDKNNKPKVVLSFKECKKCVMNTTNCETLTALFKSADVKDWVGKRIILHTEKVRGFGKMVDGIRVMNKLPKDKYICQDCGKQIKAVGNKTDYEIAEGTKKRYGVEVCWACAEKRMAE